MKSPIADDVLAALCLVAALATMIKALLMLE